MHDILSLVSEPGCPVIQPEAVMKMLSAEVRQLWGILAVYDCLHGMHNITSSVHCTPKKHVS